MYKLRLCVCSAFNLLNMRVVSHQTKELPTPLPNFRCHRFINGLTPCFFGGNNNLVRYYVEYGIVPSNLTSATEVISNRAAANSQETHSTTMQNTGRKEKALPKSIEGSNKNVKARIG